MTDDPYADPAFKEFEQHIKSGLYPMIESSAVGISLVPSKEPDVKFCIELGAMIMYDKPIILVVAPGCHVPDHLVRVADAIVEGDLSTDDTRQQLAQALEKAAKEVKGG